jgi:hypothetical protein
MKQTGGIIWRAVHVAMAIVALHWVAAGSALAQADTPQVKVGDRWNVEVRDRSSGALLRSSERRVSAVDATHIELVDNGVPAVWTRDLTIKEDWRLSYDNGYRWLAFPLEVGKKWDFKTEWKRKDVQATGRTSMSVEVMGLEKVKVKAGEFDAIRVEAKGYLNADMAPRYTGRMSATYWYAPAARAIVKLEWTDKLDQTVSEVTDFALSE